MANALRDENRITGALAVLNTDTVQGTNLVRIKINSANNGMKVDDTATISFTMVEIDERDENYIGCMTFTGTDGKVYPWVATSAGAVLIA
jgi:hypothetical protein